jgi:hypothetical protein
MAKEQEEDAARLQLPHLYFIFPFVRFFFKLVRSAARRTSALYDHRFIIIISSFEEGKQVVQHQTEYDLQS